MALAAAAFAVALIAVNLPTADKSGDRSARTYVDTLFAALPADAAILSFWGPSPPLWHAQLVLGERPDVLVVDDTNIVYEGWGTREARIDSLICSRPVFILPVNETDPGPDAQALRRDRGADGQGRCAGADRDVQPARLPRGAATGDLPLASRLGRRPPVSG